LQGRHHPRRRRGAGDHREVGHLVHLQERAHRPGPRERQALAPGERRRAHRPRGQGSRGARAARAGADQVAHAMMDLDALWLASVGRGASDVHRKPEAPPVLRINGRLETQADWGVITPEYMEGVARKILSERTYAQLRDGREIDAGYNVTGFGRF